MTMFQPIRRAAQIYRKIQGQGVQQLRLHGDRIFAYRYPAPRGYGLHGILIGVYTKKARRKWIAEDLVSLAQELGAPKSPIADD